MSYGYTLATSDELTFVLGSCMFYSFTILPVAVPWVYDSCFRFLLYVWGSQGFCFLIEKKCVEVDVRALYTLRHSALWLNVKCVYPLYMLSICFWYMPCMPRMWPYALYRPPIISSSRAPYSHWYMSCICCEGTLYALTLRHPMATDRCLVYDPNTMPSVWSYPLNKPSMWPLCLVYALYTTLYLVYIADNSAMSLYWYDPTPCVPDILHP